MALPEEKKICYELANYYLILTNKVLNAHAKYGISMKELRTGFCSMVPDLCGQLKWYGGKRVSFPLILLLFHNK